jgi:hypothetical protein
LIEIIITIICRAFVNVNEIFSYLIVPFIDHHYLYALLCNDEPLDDKEKNAFKIDILKIKKMYGACSTAIVSILKNYTGAVCFSRNITTFLSCINIHKDNSISEEIKVWVLNNFMDIFYKIFEFYKVYETAEYKICNPVFSIQEEFINAECKFFINFDFPVVLV